MPYRRLAFIQGEYYHIYNRGCNSAPIFFEERNYRFLLERIKVYAAQMRITIIAYCLMPNHYHLLLRQDGNASVSDFIQSVFNSYTKAINKTYSRSGTLFEGPFKAIAVTSEEYLLHLCRYIHRNPLEAGLATHPDRWAYSNYLEWVQRRNGSLVDRAFVHTHFATPEAYERFVVEYQPPQAVVEVVRQLAFEK